MSVLSGKTAVVNGISTVRNWNIEETNDGQPFVASNTKNGTGMIAGVNDWTGSYAAFGGTPLHMPGDVFAFLGYTAPDDGVSGVGTTYSGSAIVESVVITWDWSSAQILAHEVNFGGHLALTKTGGDTQIFDTTDPDIMSSCGTKIEFDADVAVSPAEWTDLTQAVLTLTNGVQSYVNSSTEVGGVCWTGRIAGVFNWNAAVTVQNQTRAVAAIPNLRATEQFRFWVDDTDYWDLFNGFVQGYTSMQFDRETGAIIPQTVGISMDGWPGLSVEGKVQLPGAGAAWWPVAP